MRPTPAEPGGSAHGGEQLSAGLLAAAAGLGADAAVLVHLGVGAETWVALLPGVHDLPPGAAVQAHLDPADAFVFGADGRVAERARPLAAAVA